MSSGSHGHATPKLQTVTSRSGSHTHVWYECIVELDEPIEGRWWLPGSPDISHFGRVEAEPNEFWRLNAFGGLMRRPTQETIVAKPFAADGLGVEAIHGRRAKGADITLLDCYSSGMSWDDFVTQDSWIIGGVFDEYHLPNSSALMRRAVIRLSPLLEWSCAPVLQITPWPPIDRETVSVGSSVTSMGIAELAEASLELVAGHRFSFGHWHGDVERDVYFQIEFANGHGLDALLGDYVYPLRDLLAFLTLGYTGIAPLACVPLDVEHRSGTTQYGRYYARLQRPVREPRAPTASDMLATWPRLGVDLQWLVTNWWRLVDNQGACIRMMLVPTYAPYLYADDQLLTAFLAMEAYHGRALDPHSLDPRDHSKRVDEVLAAVPREHLGWVEERLRSGNTKGQSRKLDDIVERAGSTGQRLVAVLPDFTKRANKARQHVAHPVHTHAHDAGQRFLYLGTALRWLLRHCLLLEMGFDEATVTAMMSDCNALNADLTLVARLLE
jgi:ApeA N-terminal domain 1